MKHAYTDVRIDSTMCTVIVTKYTNGNTALRALDNSDGFPYANLTVNLVNEGMEKDEVFLDVNNNPTIVENLVDAGVIYPDVIKQARSGYVVYSSYKLK